MTTTFTEMMLVLSQWVDVSILSKATLVLLLGLTATSLAKGKRASVRHLVLAAMFAALLALPLAVLTAPAVTIEVPVSSTSDSNAASDTALRATPVVPPSGADPGHRTQETSLGSVLSWHSMARWGWLSGSLLLLGSLALDSWRLRRVRRDGLPWPDLRDWIQSLGARPSKSGA